MTIQQRPAALDRLLDHVQGLVAGQPSTVGDAAIEILLTHQRDGEQCTCGERVLHSARWAQHALRQLADAGALRPIDEPLETRTDQHTVRAGQTYADCDLRNIGRTVRVRRLDMDHRCRRVAVCTVVTAADAYPDTRTGQTVRILTARMRGADWTGRTGYRLVQDAPTIIEETP